MTITKSECFERIFKIALKNVKTLDDLILIENTLEDYQEQFKVNLIKYKLEVMRMREEYHREQTIRAYKKGHHGINEGGIGRIFV